MERLVKGEYKYTQKVIVCIMLLAMLPFFGTYSINADNAHSSHIVIDSASGRVLLGDNIHARLPMASTTKIMTALVAIENGDLDADIAVTRDMVGVEGSSIYLEEGEVLSLRELIYGLMLRSGNDAATAIAIGVAGSMNAFVDLMNERANSLGLLDTHFANAHGLHDDAHYTTASDLAIIARTAMNNDEFARIVSTKSVVIGGETSKKRYLQNKNKFLRMYEGASGVKTGYTKKAGRCLVASASRGDMRLISVVLNEPNMWESSASNLDRCFGEYRMIDVATAYNEITKVRLGGKIVGVTTHNTIKYPIKENEREYLSYEVVLDGGNMSAKSGEKVGKLLVYADKHLIFEEKIYTI